MVRAGWSGGVLLASVFTSAAVALAAAAETDSDGCDRCGALPSKVQVEIDRLLSARHSWTRDDAAHDLRAFDWRCHPEILDALSTALLRDPKAHVRSEAAQTLLKIEPAPCTAEIHGALAKAAECEKNLFARLWIRKALKRIERKCPAGCAVCDANPRGPSVSDEPLFETLPPASFERESAEVRRPRVVPSPGEAPLEMWPERVPSPPRPGPPPTPSVDPFGTIPPMDPAATDAEPLPDARPVFTEPDLLPPAPPAEEAGPFERSGQPERAQHEEPRRERFASSRVADRASRDRSNRNATLEDEKEPEAKRDSSEPAIRERRRLLLRLFGRRGW